MNPAIWLTRTGTVSFDTKIVSAALPAFLADSLRDAEASTVEIQGDCVTFTRRSFRLVSNWNVLVPFESGDLTVDANARQIRYRVSVRQLVLFGTVMVGVMTALVLMFPVPQAFWFIPLTWIWLVVGNGVIGVYRFERFLRRAIARGPHLTQQSAVWNSFPT